MPLVVDYACDIPQMVSNEEDSQMVNSEEDAQMSVLVTQRGEEQ